MLIGVHNLTLPHAWYNLYGYGFSVTILPNTLGIPVNTFTVTIPTQNYTATLLASTLSTTLSTLAVSLGYAANFWVVQYDAASNYFTLNCASAVPFKINPLSSNCYYELGAKQLYWNGTPLIAIAGTLRFPDMADLTGTNGVYINLLNNNTYQRPSYQGLTQSNILCRVPVSTSFGGVEVYMPDNIQYSALPGAALSSLNITLTNDAGQLLQLNNCDWTMTLSVKFVEIAKPVMDSSNARVSTYGMSQPYGR
jgi:hypothetical protein